MGAAERPGKLGRAGRLPRGSGRLWLPPRSAAGRPAGAQPPQTPRAPATACLGPALLPHHSPLPPPRADSSLVRERADGSYCEWFAAALGNLEWLRFCLNPDLKRIVADNKVGFGVQEQGPSPPARSSSHSAHLAESTQRCPFLGRSSYFTSHCERAIWGHQGRVSTY